MQVNLNSVSSYCPIDVLMILPLLYGTYIFPEDSDLSIISGTEGWSDDTITLIGLVPKLPATPSILILRAH